MCACAQNFRRKRRKIPSGAEARLFVHAWQCALSGGDFRCSRLKSKTARVSGATCGPTMGACSRSNRRKPRAPPWPSAFRCSCKWKSTPVASGPASYASSRMRTTGRNDPAGNDTNTRPRFAPNPVPVTDRRCTAQSRAEDRAFQTGEFMATRRTTMRSRSGTKLYAVRGESGQFEDIQTYKRAHAADLRHKSAAEKGTIEKQVRKAASDAVKSV